MATPIESAQSLDSPERAKDLRELIQRKGVLRRFYAEVYNKYADCLRRCPADGMVIELGSGAGFAKTHVPGIVTSDTLPYDGVDRVIDATRMPFEDCSLRAIFLMNVFHHIPDVEAFLKEASRCLKKGGRVFILDQHAGMLGRFVFKNMHHEPFRPEATEWTFDSTGPLSGANGALAWIVFQRDRERFERIFPNLRLERYQPHSPLRYWVSGGLKKWAIAPGAAFGALTLLDRGLAQLSPELCSFVDVELVKT